MSLGSENYACLPLCAHTNPCRKTRIAIYMHSPDWLHLSLLPDLVICRLWEELDVFHGIRCPHCETMCYLTAFNVATLHLSHLCLTICTSFTIVSNFINTNKTFTIRRKVHVMFLVHLILLYQTWSIKNTCMFKGGRFGSRSLPRQDHQYKLVFTHFTIGYLVVSGYSSLNSSLIYRFWWVGVNFCKFYFKVGHACWALRHVFHMPNTLVSKLINRICFN